MNQASEDEGYSSFEDYDDGGEEGGKENQLAPSTDEGSMEEGFMTKDEESHTSRPPTIPEEEGPAPRAAAPAAGGAAAGAAAAAGGEEEGGGGDQEAAAALGRALAALRGAACRYNRDRDGVVMKSFEGSAFTVEEFRVMLGRAFHLKLSALEARCLARHLDRDGDAGVDGAEFLKEFFRLGFEERSRQQRARREKDWAARQKERAAQREKAAAALAAAERVATGPFAPADQQAALMKMTEAAVKYDRQAGLGLEGFQGSSMDAFVFKDQLRRVFRLKLSTAELSALIAYFDKDGDGTVDCAEFMIKFFQKGFEERTKRQKQIERRNKRAEQKALEERRRKEEEGMERAEAQVDHAFAARHEAAALGRLRAAAAEYDRHTGMSLKGFDGPDMTPAVFKEQLWRAFRVHLSPKELGAAMAHFDRDGSGTVECAEFLKAFFSLGAEERARRRRARRESQKRKEDEQRRQQEAKAKVAEERALGKVDWDFTEEDATSALALMREAAYKFVGSRHTPDANPLAAFQGTDMTPTVLGQQLRRALGVQATPRQLAALVRHFDKDGDGTVACAEFLIQFFRAGFEEHRKDTERHRAEEFRKAQADKAARKKKEAALEEKRQARYDPNWGEDDRGSALAKLTAVAAEYDPQSASAVGLEGFEGAGMTPFVFRDQLKRVFRIRLTPKELGALVAAFDKDGDGAIDCAEFLMRFHQLGFDERSRRRRDLRRRELRAAARAAAEERRKQAEALAKAQANVAPFEERHVDEVLQMVATAAAKYDQRTAGAAGLRAFEGAAMTPTELREQLRLAFGLRLTPAQLAALVALFDLDGDGTVDCGEFLAQFFRLGGAAKGERGGLMTKQQPPGGGGGAAAAPGGEKLDALFQRMKEVAQVFHHPLYALNQGQREALQIRRQVAPSSRFFSRPATREAERRASSAPGAGRGATPLPAAAAAGPPLTQAQRFKRRLQLAKRTGVLDASSPAAAAAGGGGGDDDGEDAAAGGAGERSGLLLRAIPNSTFSVFNLTQLWLTNNELEELPPSIEMLSGLKTLCISGNFVKILPAEIGSLENLERFYASGNELTQLPTEFGYLSNMKELLLDRNCFKDFPLQIIFLRSLEVLGLSDNVLTCLHPGLKKLRLLTTLEVDGNAALEAAGAEAVLRSLGGGSALTRLGAAGTPLAAAAAPEGEAEGARARVVAALPGLSHIRWGPDTNTPYQPLKPPAPMEYVSSKKTEYDPLLGAAEEVFDVLASEMKHMLKMRAKTAATLAQQKNRRRKM